MRNNKGLSLIEVVVSLSILAMVFAGTVTLIVNVVNLAMIARDKTEATALLQEGLTRGIDLAKNSCASGATTYASPAAYQTGGGNRYNVTVTLDDQTFSPLIAGGDASYQINKTNFVKVSTVVRWDYKAKNQVMSATQYVRKVTN